MENLGYDKYGSLRKMMGDFHRWWKDGKSPEFRWQIVPKMLCSDGYGSVGEHDMSSESTSNRESREG